ncbi:ubiquitin carboxy-terminal hydrolase (macronuclear) [Tetrahymena thermophila SB210]|uniref:Ubiquitin carboxyl-terminal hydrolase n=1 Tax=Tetrahymena thermophila (strain SB210) TaxID=312017 RepID=I7MMV5_TETTS|nr:ubiquitin carboxy-terminal hydrolase [Tetrahymena thermophila SB210]EAS07036.2 ubiquitin carboxy-terminal hydrolase [Tetrahymena thermophila SB210]|eukprot:XP_001027278.2 ubiquitin carboxy-terminal hydrolase [Tetrahymena thermophila SB210]
MDIESKNQPKIYEKMDFESGGIIKNASEQALKGKAVIESNFEIFNKWQKIHKIGPGLANLGNTCFFNSVLQCLTYTPPLANYLLSGEHKKTCPRKESFCAICLLEQHIEQCFSQNRPPVVQPRKIIQNMRYINKKFKLGRQDDSHELLRLLLESMQKSALDFKPKVDQKIEEATPIYKMFAGKLKSQVECSVCNYRSENIEAFYDLSLECKESVQKSFELFFRKEKLEGNNKYRCSKCKKLVEAQKGYVIHQLPNVLTLQIKRFNNFMMKINTHTQFPAEIDISKYVQQANKKPEIYDLYGVLIHIGGGLHFGHYYCYVKNSNDMWYCMNDSSVSQRSFQEVSKERPYLLFYVKREVITKPKRKSSADLSNLQKEVVKEAIKEAATAAIDQGKQQVLNEEQNVNNKQKTLCDEYKEIAKSEQCQEYMKQLDSLFAIKKKNEPEQKSEKIVEEKQQNKQEVKKDQIKQKQAEEQKQQDIQENKSEENKMEEEKDSNKQDQISKEIDDKFYQLQRDRMNNKYQRCQFQVVKLKKIKKLKYITDTFMRKRLRSQMANQLLYLGNSQASLQTISRQDSAEENKQKVKQINGVYVNSEALAQNIVSTKSDQSLKPTSNGSTAQSTPETKQSKQANEVLKQKEAKIGEITQNNLEYGGLIKTLQQKNEVSQKVNGQQIVNQSENKKSTNSPLNLSSLELLSQNDSGSQLWNSKESQQLAQFRNKVKEHNKNILEYQKKEKDEYDVEYDKGKLKKIKKKKEKQRINFDKLAQQQQKNKNKNGYQQYLKKNKKQYK